MSNKKTLQELTIKDNFMFCTVMSDEDNCRSFLEMVLRFPIERVEVSTERSLFYHPGFKGIRLDVYAKDEKNTRYDVEMQTIKRDVLPKRARYYHSQIDMKLLQAGAKYSELPRAYVIFICDFDPFGENKYQYTFENRCVEDLNIRAEDGMQSIYLCTHGTNDNEVPAELVRFLKFVQADLAGSQLDFKDGYIHRLQQAVENIKRSREQEERYMLFEELLEQEREEGKAEGKAECIIALLKKKGSVPENLQERILKEPDEKILDAWFEWAAMSVTVEEFQNRI